MWGSLPLMVPILLEGWWDMRLLSLCCSIGLGVQFDLRSHTRYPPYELMSRNCYVCFCWTWYQEKRRPYRLIPDEKSKTIPVSGGAVLSSFRIESQLSPGLESGTQRVPGHISPYCPHKIQHTQIGSVCSISPFCGPSGPQLAWCRNMVGNCLWLGLDMAVFSFPVSRVWVGGESRFRHLLGKGGGFTRRVENVNFWPPFFVKS
jgi:hypothetical protein